MSDTSPEKLIEAVDLTRLYGNIRAVDNVSFTLNKGEVLGFLGPNGAGKTTTMQMLCGALAPTGGSIKINDIDLLEQPLRAKQVIGFLPEKPPLYIELTVDEYLGYCSQLHKIEKAFRAKALDSVKQRCGLTEVGSRLIGNLSKGFQQRVGIAQAIIHSPHVVILDEPTVGLDPIQIREIRQLIKQLGRDHGVILSTHILPEVQMTCNRVQIINRGRLVFHDSVDNLKLNTAATSLIIGLRRPPQATEIENVSGVNKIETITNSRFRIHFNNGQSPAEEIAKLAVEKNWGLIELTPESRNLEQIFIELTSTEITDPETSREKAA
ncbi:MAG: ATP-binding cassette domain-containing protein [Gammaproteobacteria bacterium]|nr:ATP-binding cassette domain-containing protein [Gammaproteobacteria bacterium]